MTISQLRETIFARDYGNPYMSSRGAGELAISVIFTALATCFVSARVYTRGWLMRRMESNDWMVVIALVSISQFRCQIQKLIR